MAEWLLFDHRRRPFAVIKSDNGGQCGGHDGVGETAPDHPLVERLQMTR